MYRLIRPRGLRIPAIMSKDDSNPSMSYDQGSSPMILPSCLSSSSDVQKSTDLATFPQMYGYTDKNAFDLDELRARSEKYMQMEEVVETEAALRVKLQSNIPEERRSRERRRRLKFIGKTLTFKGSPINQHSGSSIRLSMPSITFTDEDFRGVDPVQDDPMVISVDINNIIV
ncbi:hypothetical protein Fmac_001578 [Flemingia macrophylla]|uniref:Ribosomal protein S4 n=1 Tax=Flemingia macrophylla TaxID=520843 RepID=A0ABD1NHI2_9FABA